MTYEELVDKTPPVVLGGHLQWLVLQTGNAAEAARLAEREAKARRAARQNQAAAIQRARAAITKALLQCEALGVDATEMYTIDTRLQEHLAQTAADDWPERRRIAARARSALRAVRSHARADSPVPARKACLSAYREALQVCPVAFARDAIADLRRRLP